MSGKKEHDAVVVLNQELIDLLCANETHKKKFSHWIVVIIFYKAIHMIEAMFAEMGVPHLDVHTGERRSDFDDRRNGLLKTRSKYVDIFRPFDALRRLSFIARYSGCGIDMSGNPIAYDSDEILASAEKYVSQIEAAIAQVHLYPIK